MKFIVFDHKANYILCTIMTKVNDVVDSIYNSVIDLSDFLHNDKDIESAYLKLHCQRCMDDIRDVTNRIIKLKHQQREFISNGYIGKLYDDCVAILKTVLWLVECYERSTPWTQRTSHIKYNITWLNKQLSRLAHYNM